MLSNAVLIKICFMLQNKNNEFIQFLFNSESLYSFVNVMVIGTNIFTERLLLDIDISIEFLVGFEIHYMRTKEMCRVKA